MWDFGDGIRAEGLEVKTTPEFDAQVKEYGAAQRAAGKAVVSHREPSFRDGTIPLPWAGSGGLALIAVTVWLMRKRD